MPVSLKTRPPTYSIGISEGLLGTQKLGSHSRICTVTRSQRIHRPTWCEKQCFLLFLEERKKMNPYQKTMHSVKGLTAITLSGTWTDTCHLCSLASLPGQHQLQKLAPLPPCPHHFPHDCVNILHALIWKPITELRRKCVFSKSLWQIWFHKFIETSNGTIQKMTREGWVELKSGQTRWTGGPAWQI